MPRLASLRYALRRLRRAPTFTAAAILTIALGIGATTAVFSIVDAVLLRPLPYPGADRLVDLSHTLTLAGISRVDQSDATFLYYRQANRRFADIAVFRITGVNVSRSGSDAASEPMAERVQAGIVSASTFGVLRTPVARGRVFRDDDERPGAPPVVILGARLWSRLFGRDATIIGQTVRIDGIAREVVGIMPASFDLPGAATELWLPASIDPTHTASASFDYRGIGRLRDGVPTETAAAELQRLLPRVPEAYPGRLTASSIEQIRMRAVVRPLREVVVGDTGRVLWVLLGAAACVLLAACANVTNLLLVRADARQHEMAVRRALGAGRVALVSEHATESLIIALTGGLLALGIAAGGVHLLIALREGGTLPRLAEVRMSGAVLATAASLTLLVTCLVGGLPALRAIAVPASSALRDAGRGMTVGRSRHGVRNLLVVSQVAVALVLLIGSGLMARSFARLRAVPTGFHAAHTFVVRIALPRAGYAAPGVATRFIQLALRTAGAVPGVGAVGAITKLPLMADARQDSALFVEDHPLAPGSMPNLHQVAFASPDYFRAMGVPVLDGRTFEPLDPARAPREVLLAASVAARYWPSGRAVGRRVRLAPAGDWYTVVGVVGDVRGTALDQPPDEIVYLPLVVTLGGSAGGPSAEQRWTPRDLAFVIRTAGDPETVGPRAAATIRALDPTIPGYGARAMTAVVADAAARTTLMLLLLGIASAIALALGAIGIYGVLAYVVSLRTREIAVRLALGATPGAVRSLIARRSATVVSAGIAAGLIASIALTRVLGALLFGVSPLDPVALLAAIVAVGVVSAAATWVPAHRASRLQPARALHAD